MLSAYKQTFLELHRCNRFLICSVNTFHLKKNSPTFNNDSDVTSEFLLAAETILKLLRTKLRNLTLLANIGLPNVCRYINFIDLIMRNCSLRNICEYIFYVYIFIDYHLLLATLLCIRL